MTEWFTSDWHFHHRNLCRGESIGSRVEFANVDQMNDYIVEAHNRVVRPHDIVWCLGDVTLQRGDPGKWLGIVRRLEGRKRLILGNHDHFTPQDYLTHAGFEQVVASYTHYKLLFSHIPIHPAQFYRFRANVHGHTHGNMVPSIGDTPGINVGGVQLDPRYINMCVEPRLYTPVSLNALLDEVADANL